MDYCGFIAVLTQYLLEETVTGHAHWLEHRPHTLARVHQESQDQGKFGLARKITDLLRAPIFFQPEILLREILNNRSRAFVPYSR